jgi:hypothetical protein
VNRQPLGEKKKEAIMKQGLLIQNIYGYLVCLISIIVILIALPLLLESTIDLIKPDSSDRKPYILNQSFEYWKTTNIHQFCEINNEIDINNCTLPSENELLSLFTEGKNNAKAGFVQGTVLLLIQRLFLVSFTTVLFILHWNWLKRINREK